MATRRLEHCRNSVSDLFVQSLQTAKRGKEKSQIKCKLPQAPSSWLSLAVSVV